MTDFNLPNDEIMRQLSKIALEKATEELAKKAEEFAKSLPPEVDGTTALTAFADAIRSTNSKVWPGSGSA